MPTFELGGRECLVSSANDRCIFIENYGEGNVRQDRTQPPFAATREISIDLINKFIKAYQSVNK